MSEYKNHLVALPKDQEAVVFTEEQLRGMMKTIQTMPLPLMLSLLEKKMIYAALQVKRWNRSEAAKLLGMSRRAFNYRMERFGITQSGVHEPACMGPVYEMEERPMQAERIVRSGGKLINIEVGIKIEI